MHGPPKPGEQQRRVLNRHRAWEQLDWRPQLGLAQGLSRTAAAFREAGEPAAALGSA